MLKIERTKDGRIKDFSVPDAHTLYIAAYIRGIDKNGNLYERPPKKEAIMLSSLDDLDRLWQMKDPDDYVDAFGRKFSVGEKYAMNPQVIADLKSKGEAEFYLPHNPIRFKYWLRKVRFSDNLRHKG